MRNFGLILEPLRPDTGFVGGIEPELPILNPSGDWERYLPVYEQQSKYGLETMNCFTYDTQVLMEDYTLRNICDVQVGDYVVTHEGRKRRVTETMIRPYDGELTVITVKGVGEDITCTPEHPFLTVRGWVMAKDLTLEDEVLCPVLQENTEYRKYGVESDKDFLWLLGVYIAEGCVSGINVTFCISTEEVEFAERIKAVFKKTFGKELHDYVNTGTKSLRLTASCATAANILSTLGGKLAGEKKLTPHLLEILPEKQLEILRGWLDGDGHLDGRRLQGVTISKNLASQFRQILQRLGIRSTMMTREAVDNHREAYDILVNGEGINIIYPNTVEDAKRAPANVASRLSEDKKSFIRGISSIEKRTSGKAGGNKKVYNVYNIEVDEDHSYVVASVAVHNCVQFSRLNVCETLANFFGKPLNLSDRFFYWASGCSEKGNTFSRADVGIKRYGVPAEVSWPWLVPLTREEYGQEPPEAVQEEARTLLEHWDIGMIVWVPSTIPALKTALRKGPIWFCNQTHAMMVYAIDDRIRVYDTYGGGKGSFPLDYVQHIVAAFLAPFTPKELMTTPVMPFDFKENTLYQVVEGKGGFLLFAAGKLYYDDVAKLLASWIVRNGGKGEGKVGVLKLSDFAGVQLYDLKNNPVTF